MVATMATEPTQNRYGRPFTLADLEHLPDDGRRYEIIDGVLVVSGAPSHMHQRAVTELIVLLHAACPAEFEVLTAPFAVVLAEDTMLLPDVLVARRNTIAPGELPGPPELAIEVLSPSTRLIDINVKRPRLERAGAANFWVVHPAEDPSQARLVAWELGDDKKYREIADVRGEKEFCPKSPYPVTIVPAALVS